MAGTIRYIYMRMNSIPQGKDILLFCHSTWLLYRDRAIRSISKTSASVLPGFQTEETDESMRHESTSDLRLVFHWVSRLIHLTQYVVLVGC
jgi:hypothetical protein